MAKKRKKKEVAKKYTAKQKEQLVKEWLDQSDSEDKMTMEEYREGIQKVRVRERAREKARRSRERNKDKAVIFNGYNTVKG